MGPHHLAATHAAAPQSWLVYIVVAGLLVFRYSRPMRMTVTRMWITPLIYVALTLFAIWGGQMVSPAPIPLIALALVAGIIAGIPLGMLRGAHTTVRATDRPGVMYLGPSWIVAVIWIGACDPSGPAHHICGLADSRADR